MKNVTKVLGIMAFCLAFGINAKAQTATADASATIIEAISITNTVDLNFGQIIADVDGGTVEITPLAAGSTQTATGIVLGPLNTFAAAEFDVVGGNLCTYDINLPADGVVTIDDAGAGVAMDVDGFTTVAAAGSAGTLSATGTQTLIVGATLTINAAQAAGDYTGTFDVSVNYN